MKICLWCYAFAPPLCSENSSKFQIAIIIANTLGKPTKPCAEHLMWIFLFSLQDNYQEGIYGETEAWGRFSESDG